MTMSLMKTMSGNVCHGDLMWGDGLGCSSHAFLLKNWWRRSIISIGCAGDHTYYDRYEA